MLLGTAVPWNFMCVEWHLLEVNTV